MNKFKQCSYTIILLITCFLISPKIYKDIWNSSKEKKKASNYKPPVIDLTTPSEGAPASTVPNNESTVQTTTTLGGSGIPGGADTSTTTTEAVTTGTGQIVVEFGPSDPSYFDDALFIGDSRTVGLQKFGTLSNAGYYCDVGLASYKIDSDTVAGMLSGKNYNKIYIMLGINEVGNDFEYTVSCFRRLVDNIRAYKPDALVYLCANLRVTEEAQQNGITNERIDYLNSRISAFANNKDTFYIDINPVFSDANGALRSDCTSDGVHVYAQYYPTWCDWLCLNTISYRVYSQN